jgi:hypothetical protein
MEHDKNELIVSCPHCSEHILIEKLNCCIFRHGSFIKNGKQIDPHLPKEQCERLIKKRLIYGCGKPFKIIKNTKDDFEATICDYI